MDTLEHVHREIQAEPDYQIWFAEPKLEALEVQGLSFWVDRDITRAYHQVNELCDCEACRNYYLQIRRKHPELAAFLEAFGLDVERPDALHWLDTKPGEYEYLMADYCVCGRLSEEYTLQVEGLEVMANGDYVPSDHGWTQTFALSVLGLRLPNLLEASSAEKNQARSNGCWIKGKAAK